MNKMFGSALIASVTVCFTLAGCGFKSDLFIPGEPQHAGQLDSSSIDTLKQQTLDTLQDKDTEIFKTKVRDVVETQPVNPAEGVPVMIEPLSEDEIKKNRDKNILQ